MKIKNRKILMRVWVTMIGLLSIHSAMAMPAQIVIFRHAEKINDQDPGLSSKGTERARLLPGFFANDPHVNRYGNPVAIYAMEPKSESHSQRSILTVQPLAKKLGLKIIANVERDQVKKLTKKITNDENYDGRTVIICWQHGKIDNILKQFGYRGGPKNWGDVYDRVWVVDFTQGKPTFKDIPMKLLPGDSES